MYFDNRGQAGAQLAAVLADHRFDNCAVVALNEGGVVVGEQIAAQLHCVLMLLLSEDIEVPGENLLFGSVSQEGDFTYNSGFSSGEIDEYSSEFHGYLEEKKRESFQSLNRLVGDGGTINRDLLKERVVILVSDSLDSPAAIDVALEFLKPVRVKRLVVAAPLATVPAVDRVHMVADEVRILDVRDNYMGVNHYYTDNTVPPRQVLIDKIEKIILNWR